MTYPIKLAKTYIKSDLFRYTGSTSTSKFLSQYLTNRSFKYSFWLRLANVSSVIIRVPSILIHKYLSNKYSIQIGRTTPIGHGLYIAHHMCIVMNKTVTIGSNCNISQFLTIGSNNGKAAIIGNNVYIGPNVCLVENIVIGDNVTIGAGSVVTHDIPPNCTAVGNPARVISQKNPGRYIINKWE